MKLETSQNTVRREKPYTETTKAKNDRGFQAAPGLFGKNRLVALKQHWGIRL